MGSMPILQDSKKKFLILNRLIKRKRREIANNSKEYQNGKTAKKQDVLYFGKMHLPITDIRIKGIGKDI